METDWLEVKKLLLGMLVGGLTAVLLNVMGLIWRHVREPKESD